MWHCWGCGAAGGAYDAALAHGLSARDAIDLMIADDLATRRIGAPSRRCPSSLARLEAQVPERPRGRGSRSTFCACATSPSRDRGRGVIGRIASFAGGLPLGELACCAGVAGNLQPVCGHPGTAELSVSPSARSVPFSISRGRCCERWRARSRALVGERLAGVWMSAVHAGRWVVRRTVGLGLASGGGERQDGSGVSVPWFVGGVCSGSGGAGVVSPLARVRIARMVPCATCADVAMSRWASPSRAARAIAW